MAEGIRDEDRRRRTRLAIEFLDPGTSIDTLMESALTTVQMMCPGEGMAAAARPCSRC